MTTVCDCPPAAVLLELFSPRLEYVREIGVKQWTVIYGEGVWKGRGPFTLLH